MSKTVQTLMSLVTRKPVFRFSDHLNPYRRFFDKPFQTLVGTVNRACLKAQTVLTCWFFPVDYWNSLPLPKDGSFIVFVRMSSFRLNCHVVLRHAGQLMVNSSHFAFNFLLSVMQFIHNLKYCSCHIQVLIGGHLKGLLRKCNHWY